MANDDGLGVSFHDLSSGGESGRLIQEKNWSATLLGARNAWPRSLNNYLRMILELPTAAILFWGPDRVQLYNDGYSVIMGPRHPQYLGATFRECWPEAYEAIDPWMKRVENGETVKVNRTLVPLTRFGFTEEAYFTFSFSPLRDDDGRIAGILQLVTEVTDAVLGDRRALALHELSNQTAQAKTAEDATRLAATVLEKCGADLPFFLIYVVDPLDTRQLTLSGSTGARGERFPKRVELRSDDQRPGRDARYGELLRAISERRLVDIEQLGACFGIPPAGLGADVPARAVAVPIAAPGQQSVVAVLVAGISPRLRLDNPYRNFLELVSAQLATLIAAARAFDEEKKRSEALAAIDRAKTEFFSNVSHEFRTPLTLILGPLEDALRDPANALQGEALLAVHRNALRLLRLVNTLLDFARIEANRLTSTFEPTDLPTLTAGLAGAFQSLLESAGLKLRVECPPLSLPVYVDRSQWEKIVLNLISNAFKFTFAGEIVVRLHEADGLIHLSVSDTGTGIPAEELPKIFERFHRVSGARGRSFEGTGIGLALVEELTKRHGGTVRVESVVGKGTTFVVSIPSAVRQSSGDSAASDGSTAGESAGSHVIEAERWNDAVAAAGPSTKMEDALTREHAHPETHGSDGASPRSRARVLVADDNADMRQYLVRLLSPKWSVETAEDGQAALEAALRQPPDLVLSDVMMPRMDGVALLGALRKNPATSTIPVVLLSARAGEEAVVGGFDTGADDYLVKPFAARELLARVEAHVNMARLRREWAAELERANKELEAFSYSVSHDLRAPLRAIDGFTKVLMEDYAAKLDGTANHYLGRVRQATERMAQLIDDLLELSRISRAPVNRTRVDVTELVSRIVVELRESDSSRSVEIHVAPGLAADADPRLLAVVFENLLRNAWKFTSKRSDARIEVGHEHRAGEQVLFVRDNGAGFDMTHAARLFGPFQRLHAEADFPGTGIGLATVARIVSRHGGRIWADAAENGGATFYFTLAA